MAVVASTPQSKMEVEREALRSSSPVGVLAALASSQPASRTSFEQPPLASPRSPELPRATSVSQGAPSRDVRPSIGRLIGSGCKIVHLLVPRWLPAGGPVHELESYASEGRPLRPGCAAAPDIEVVR